MNIASLDFEELIHVLEQFNDAIPKSACAICFFEHRLRGEEASLANHRDRFCPVLSRRCLVCLEEGDSHRANDCEFKLT